MTSRWASERRFLGPVQVTTQARVMSLRLSMTLRTVEMAKPITVMRATRTWGSSGLLTLDEDGVLVFLFVILVVVITSQYIKCNDGRARAVPGTVRGEIEVFTSSFEHTVSWLACSCGPHCLPLPSPKLATISSNVKLADIFVQRD